MFISHIFFSHPYLMMIISIVWISTLQPFFTVYKVLWRKYFSIPRNNKKSKLRRKFLTKIPVSNLNDNNTPNLIFYMEWINSLFTRRKTKGRNIEMKSNWLGYSNMLNDIDLSTRKDMHVYSSAQKKTMDQFPSGFNLIVWVDVLILRVKVLLQNNDFIKLKRSLVHHRIPIRLEEFSLFLSYNMVIGSRMYYVSRERKWNTTYFFRIGFWVNLD